ncbi:tetratricopeptide repeat protein [Pseudaquabacterium pictum]|uniref:tetratricopeptide repeat protein n=1 Tax=Pseudaquabacterium pictum TaxID=2315236 RepID=UPI0010F6614B|nr:tetratricopeptide repeat protein [Rubrivivax pictus]
MGSTGLRRHSLRAKGPSFDNRRFRTAQPGEGERSMHKDRYGLACTGSAAAVQRLARAQEHLLRFRPEVVDELDNAIAEDAGCVMARAARAWIGLMSSEWPDTRAAAELVAGTRSSDAREQAHLEAIRAWSSGDMHACSRLLDALLDAHPRDALALYVGHQIDFFCGDAVNLRDRVVRSRRGWDTQHPDFSAVDGMLAFGLEECGDYARAEDIGRRAVERHADDVWAIHAVVHVLEMQARFDEGIAFLEARRCHWAEGNFLNAHNGWHLAVFLLEREDHPGALAIYDSLLHHAASPGVALEMLDASGLLWRLSLDGVDTGGRWAALADAWAAKDPTPWYVFNDLHAIMAFVGAGRQALAEQRVAQLERYLREGDLGQSNHRMVAGAGLAAARALTAWGRGDDDAAVSALAPVRHQLSVFGGSHAQRDACQRTLLCAAMRGGHGTLARQLLDERLAAKPGSLWNRMRDRQSRGLDAPAA